MLEKKLKFIMQCAKLYFEEGLDQTSISKKLGLSKATVWRYLQEAKDYLEIKIAFKNNKGEAEYIINKIKELYNLNDIRIVFENSYANQSTLQAIGTEAGIVLDEIIARNQGRTVICVPGGETMFNFVDSIKPISRNIDIYPLVLLPRGMEIVRVDSSVIVTLFWAKSKPSSRGFILPYSPESSINLELKRKDLFQQIYEKANVFFLTLGPNHKYDPQKYVDINGQTIDENSNSIEPTNQYAFSFYSFKDMKFENKITTICVAIGKEKIDGLRIALNNNLVDILVTDYLTALDLLS